MLGNEEREKEDTMSSRVVDAGDIVQMEFAVVVAIFHVDED